MLEAQNLSRWRRTVAAYLSGYIGAHLSDLNTHYAEQFSLKRRLWYMEMPRMFLDRAASTAGRRCSGQKQAQRWGPSNNISIDPPGECTQPTTINCASAMLHFSDCKHPNMSPSAPFSPKGLSEALLPWVFVPQMAPAKGSDVLQGNFMSDLQLKFLGQFLRPKGVPCERVTRS